MNGGKHEIGSEPETVKHGTRVFMTTIILCVCCIDKIKELIDFHKVNSKDTDSFMVVHKTC